MFDFRNIKTTVSKDELYQFITPESIFQFYFGDFRLRKTFSSPFRIDKNPSFGFYYNRMGEIVCNDIVSKEKLDAIGFVAKLHTISRKEAIYKIMNDFNIECESIYNKKHQKIISKVISESEKRRKETKIQIVRKNFTTDDKNYWNKWQFSEKELEQEFIYSVEKLYINGNKIPLKKTEICFAIYQQNKEKTKGYFKILQPFSKNKWISNIPLDLPFGIDRLPYSSEHLIITKSAKDRMCLKKIFSDVLGTQNESINAVINCVPESKLYKKTTVIFDADSPGVNACIEITKKYNWNYFNTPFYLYKEKNITDIAEYVEYFGYKTLTKLLKEKQIL